MNINDKKREVYGEIEVVKIPVDGSGAEEVIYSENNIICSGLGFTLAQLFGGVGSQNIADYTADRFQVETGGTGTDVSSYTKLKTPLTESQYGANTNLVITNSHFYDPTRSSGQSAAQQAFALLPTTNRTQISNHSARFTLVLDENTANGHDIDEIGIYAKNPGGHNVNTSVLVAYKKLGSVVSKNANFSAVFRWTINL